MSKLIICEKCGKDKPYYANGLCELCYMRCWQRANPEKMSANSNRCYKKHREKRLVYQHQYDKNHREEKSAYSRSYYKKRQEENPEYNMIKCAKRRAYRQATANTLTSKQIEFERIIGQATYPDEKLHMHHLVPLSKGGGHTWGNIVFIPALFNLSIQNKLPEEVYIQTTFII